MKVSEIPQEKIDEICSDLEGRSISIEDIMEVYGLEIDKDDRELLRFRLEEQTGLEQCDQCGTWVPKETLFKSLVGELCNECQSTEIEED